ncbi:MAG TPA: FHA domain-containing protein [Propionibacterium sp.]|nr:FHA domain-containing protein [Propionibacterium sp.]
MPQPVIGRAVLNSGQEIRLSGPVILGREPEAKRVTDGPLPTLVPLPRNHISRNHVRLLVEGWQAFAADLHSKNGTVLYRRGHPPVRLTERPAQLSQGDVLDFGHGVILTIEELP